MELAEILTYGMGVLMTILGFLLKSVYADIRECKKEFAELRQKAAVQDEHNKHAQHVENIKLKQINDILSQIKEEIELLKDEFGYLRRKRDEKGRYIKTKKDA